MIVDATDRKIYIKREYDEAISLSRDVKHVFNV